MYVYLFFENLILKSYAVVVYNVYNRPRKNVILLIAFVGDK